MPTPVRCLLPHEGTPRCDAPAFLLLPHSLDPRRGKVTGKRGCEAECAEPTEGAAHLLLCTSNDAGKISLSNLELSVSKSPHPQREAKPFNTGFTSHKDALFGFHLPYSFVLFHNLAQNLYRREPTYWASSSPNKCVILSSWFADYFSHSS